MKTRNLPILLLTAVLLITACSPLTSIRESTDSSAPEPSMELSSPSAGYQPVVINVVQVEVGAGSPIPVQVRVIGTLPDTCSQIEYTEMRQDGFDFLIKLSAIPGGESCGNDTLPFSMSIPLNMIDRTAGLHAVIVNGVRAEFRLESGHPAALPWPRNMPIVKRDIQVDHVGIEIRAGSPVPVYAVASGNLPLACAQLGEIRLHRDKNTYFVQLLAYLPAESECGEAGVPFRLEIPLNVVNLPDGRYSVNVNGAGAGFTLPPGAGE